LSLVVFYQMPIPRVGDLLSVVVGEGGGYEPAIRTEEGAEDLGEVIVVRLGGGAADGAGVLEGAVEGVEGRVLVDFGFVLGGEVTEG